MTSPRLLLLPLALAVLPAAARAAAPDIQTPQTRQVTVANAERLWRRPPPPQLTTDLPSPFNPIGFERPDGGDAASRAGGVGRSAPAGDRETLEQIAAQINPSGVLMLRGAPRLIISNRPFEVGTRFTASYGGQDYELELVAIDRTTFTLRYRSEELTRPIKPVR
jgi:hypothetical protein